VKEVVKNGKQTLASIAYRLIRKCFSEQELLVKNVTLLGGKGGNNPKLDPARIDLIKSHLVKLNGGHLLSSQQWAKCNHHMSKSISKK
jgi:hypothetical protein